MCDCLPVQICMLSNSYLLVGVRVGSIISRKHCYQEGCMQSKPNERKNSLLTQDEHTICLCGVGEKTRDFCLLELYFLNKVSNQLQGCFICIKVWWYQTKQGQLKNGQIVWVANQNKRTNTKNPNREPLFKLNTLSNVERGKTHKKQIWNASICPPHCSEPGCLAPEDPFYILIHSDLVLLSIESSAVWEFFHISCSLVFSQDHNIPFYFLFNFFIFLWNKGIHSTIFLNSNYLRVVMVVVVCMSLSVCVCVWAHDQKMNSQYISALLSINHLLEWL